MLVEIKKTNIYVVRYRVSHHPGPHDGEHVTPEAYSYDEAVRHLDDIRGFEGVMNARVVVAPPGHPGYPG